MDHKVIDHISADALLANPAIRKVARWKLPNSDGDYVAAKNIEFAKMHMASLFKFAGEALGQICEKGKAVER